MTPEFIEQQKEKLLVLKEELEHSLADENGQADMVPQLDGSIGRISRSEAMVSQQMGRALPAAARRSLTITVSGSSC